MRIRFLETCNKSGIGSGVGKWTPGPGAALNSDYKCCGLPSSIIMSPRRNFSSQEAESARLRLRLSMSLPLPIARMVAQSPRFPSGKRLFSTSNTSILLQKYATLEDSNLSKHNYGKEEDGKEDSDTPSSEVSKSIVGWWYLFSASLVFGIVILGGLTRLTESGLSIVEWNLIKGMKPPSNEEEWTKEFEKYKAFPEFKLLNHSITMEEFKRIFYMEWAHRMWGRAIGLAFIIPGLYFASRAGYMTRAIKARSLIIAALIGSQGVLGWYMVKSGLDPKILEKKEVPRVNHFWLSAHLGSAFLIYCGMLITGLEILKQNSKKVTSSIPVHPLFKRSAHLVAMLVFLTAISGAWVAGLDAGLIYNEFPYMGEGLIPGDMWALSTPGPNNVKPMPWWENLAKNPSAVQFNHRLLAMTTFTSITTLWLISRRLPLPHLTRLATTSLMGIGLLQVTLGISTLIYLVPVPLAVAHQGGSLTLLSVAVWLMHTMRRFPK